MHIVTIVLLAACGAAATAVACRGESGAPVPNLCREQAGLPFCVDRAAEGEEPNYECAECHDNCDCGIGHYCPSSPGATRGTCVVLEEDVIGRSCNYFWMRHEGLSWSGADGPVPVRNVDDTTVCGLPVFGGGNDTFLYYEWLGYCDAGVCKQCGNIGPELDALFGYMRQPQTMQCPGRVCHNGFLRAATVAEPEAFSLLSTNTGILVVLIFILCVASTHCVSGMRNRPKRGNPNRYVDLNAVAESCDTDHRK